MNVKFYGTRGSIAVARGDVARYGGNTTCLRITSECLPQGRALVVDTGTGFVPCSHDLRKEGVFNVDVLYTHYHTDHTGGALLAPHTFIPKARMRLWGPKEHGTGPAEVMQDIMKPPHFPVHFNRVRHRFDCHNLEFPGTQVLVVHPTAGFHLIQTHVFERALADNKQLPLGKTKYAVEECLIVRMFLTVHPEYTVSYRFEEMPTGRVFVFLTDHENTDGLPQDFLGHLKGAHLLVADAQYSRAVYDSRTAGFGHGTPDYCARIAAAAGVEVLGITHHDPMASDADVDARLKEAHDHLMSLERPTVAERTFACADYLNVQV